MSLFKRLINYALKNYYPKHHLKIEEEEYDSLEEKYDTWFSHIYLNGLYSLNEEVTINRTIADWYLVDNVENENDLYSLGVRCINWTREQELNITIHYDDSKTYTMNCTLSNDTFILQALPSKITKENINSISYSSNEYVKGKLIYNGLSSSINRDELEIISKNDFNKLYLNILK